ncbi:VOC family protein [Desulfuribacillus alkaliarsenatis]|uniref:MerR family transcriptional regulator n=1 Tax=Desulfuribacillus alkaliarsenatis TaxID=766136 RepID=A0A1E5G0W9_9FIRM|nr:VOC family protein [Desulfuribacillus alkaliarsenatis]OEF96558.1 MerR family transcriptional regulator [Desulfuribacillus alkaliarsenatis]
MVGVEIDMIVSDSLKALEQYEKIFDIERIEVTDFSKGENEVVFSLYGVKFHMLDENHQLEMIAPKPDDPKTIWFNIMVPDIAETYANAIEAGCTEVQPVTEITDFGVSNAMFSDSFGYIWMLHQVHREVSFEERTKLWEERKKSG